MAIVDCYVQKIVNTDAKKYGFVQAKEYDSAIYIPAKIVDDFDLDENDEGAKLRVIVMPSTRPGSAEWYVAMICTDDDALVEKMRWYKSECVRYQALLEANGIAYE